MSTFLVRRDFIWLFGHQAATGVAVLLLLAAALSLTRDFRLRPWHAVFMPVSVLWAWITIYGVDSKVAGITATVLMIGHVGTGIVIWRSRASAAPVLAWSFIPWACTVSISPAARLAAVLCGVFIDVLFLFTIGLGLLFVVLGSKRTLASRTAETQLTRLLRAPGGTPPHRACTRRARC
jgi:hypothetical protein